MFPILITLFTILQPPPLPPFNNPVSEQAFLAKNYDENSKKSDRDPRGAFRNPAEFSGASAGIVGPLGSSSFNLPNVERALSEMESGIGAATTTAIEGTTRRLAGRAGTGGRPAGLSPLGTSSSPANVNSSRSPGSPSANTGTPSPGATGQSQHEVLQNFFQSLLSTNTKDRAAANRGATGLRTNGVSNGMEETS